MSDQQYFSSHPVSEANFRPLRVMLDGEERNLVTASGMFNPDQIDKGTAILLKQVPHPSGQNLLDIGCGWGTIALSMALQAPQSTVWAVDVNPRALETTRQNAARLGLNVTALRPDQVDDTLRFDTIWSNPPIRIGKQALHELLLMWLPRLAPGGTAWLVVQKNLGADSLLKWLQDRLPNEFVAARVSTEKAFRIITVNRAPGSG